MRIALLGNMNNNGFALLRYFRDLGADAELLLFSNDGRDALNHFRPEDDTWEFERWAPHVRRTRIVNGPVGVLGLLPGYRQALWARHVVKLLLRRPGRRFSAPPHKGELRDLLRRYDAFVGSGIAPAVLHRVGVPLDIFYPYSLGIEYFAAPHFIRDMRSPGRGGALRRVAAEQADGILRARHCLNAEMGPTREAFRRLGVEFRPLPIPMVYNRESHPEHELSAPISRLRDEIRSSDLAVSMHSRLLWENRGDYTDSEWKHVSKHNDWLIRGFAELLRRRPEARCLLVLARYGPDVEQTDALCAALGIREFVRWLPSLPRRELMRIIGWCHVGAGEFYAAEGVLWGGTGWEVLASGKPLLQAFRFEDGEFERLFGYPPPPLLNVCSPEDIVEHLVRMVDAPDERETIGGTSRAWFERHNGIGLAKQWLELLQYGVPRGTRDVVVA